MSELQVNVDAARTPEQRGVLEDIIDDGVCPFCIESLAKYHKLPILREGDFWLATENQWPYKFTRSHHLIIAKQHVETITELPSGAFEELGEHAKALVTENSMEYGGLAMRFGTPEMTGASVRHLHVHLLRAAENLAEGEKLKFKFGG